MYQIKLMLKRKEFTVCLFIGMAVAFTAFFISCKTYYGVDAYAVLPANIEYFGLDSNEMTGKVMMFALPFLAVIPFADSYITDIQNYTLPILINRVGARRYYYEKGLAASLGAFLIVVIPFLSNLLLCLAAFPLTSTRTCLNDAAQTTFYSEFTMSKILFPRFSMQHPYLYILFFIFLTAIFYSLLAFCIYSISYFLSKNRVVLLSLFFLITALTMYIDEMIPRESKFPALYIGSYLYARDTMPRKTPLILLAYFLIVIAIPAIISPFAVKKLKKNGGRG